MYSEKYKTLSKEIKEYLHQWKDILYKWIERLKNVKIIFSRVIHRLIQSLSKYQWSFFAKCKSQPSNSDESRGPQIAKTVLKKKKKDVLTSQFQNLT